MVSRAARRFENIRQSKVRRWSVGVEKRRCWNVYDEMPPLCKRVVRSLLALFSSLLLYLADRCLRLKISTLVCLFSCISSSSMNPHYSVAMFSLSNRIFRLNCWLVLVSRVYFVVRYPGVSVKGTTKVCRVSCVQVRSVNAALVSNG